MTFSHLFYKGIMLIFVFRHKNSNINHYAH